jgi:hypothetical protein
LFQFAYKYYRDENRACIKEANPDAKKVEIDKLFTVGYKALSIEEKEKYQALLKGQRTL